MPITLQQRLDVVAIMTDQTVTGAGSTVVCNEDVWSWQAVGTTSSGAGAATVRLEVCNDNTTWMSFGTVSLTLGTTISGDGSGSLVPWKYKRANVVSISGTGAKVSVYLTVRPGA